MNEQSARARPHTAKQALRRELLALRGAIAKEDKQAWDVAINAAITAQAWFLQAESILAYYPVHSEPDIKPALRQALCQGKQVYLPRCEPETGSMAFYRIQSLEGLQPGAHGIPAPEGCVPCGTDPAQLCLVPGVAFDKAGFRLGYGGGYYDRFLARRSDLKTLGVCYGSLLRVCLPKDAHDIAVGRIITEKGPLEI